MKPILVAAGFILLGAVIYLNSFTNGFHYDDGHHITGNPNIRGIHNIPQFFTDPSAFSGLKGGRGGMYRPLLLTTYAVNWSLSEYNVVSYHLVNLFFHIGTAFLIYLIIGLIIGLIVGLSVRSMTGHTSASGQQGKDYVTWELPAALAAGVIFLVHPFNSEVVNYITARSSVMSAFFYLLAFYFWVRFRQDKSQIFYGASLFSFLLAMLTKESAITLPIILFLFDLYFKERGWKGYLAHLPFLAGVAAPFLIIRRSLAGGILSLSTSGGYYEYLLAQPGVLFEYIRLLFVPNRLSVVHTVPSSPNIDASVILFTLSLSFLIALAIWLSRRDLAESRIASFFILWFFITLLPTTLIPLKESLQENRGYVASISFAVLGGIVFTSLNRMIARRGNQTWHRIFYTSFILLLCIYSLTTVVRNRVWRTDVTLWEDAVQKAPTSFRAHYSLASAYFDQGHYAPAAGEYAAALKTEPDSLPTRYNLGIAYLRLHKPDLALIQFENAGRLSTDDAEPYRSAGDIYASRREWPKAEEAYKKGLQADANHAKTLSGLGLIYLYQGRHTEAIPYLERALQVRGDWGEVETMLAYTLEKAGRGSEAEALYRKNAGNMNYTDFVNEIRKRFEKRSQSH